MEEQTNSHWWPSYQLFDLNKQTNRLINTSPEPFSNWGASVAEDLAVFAGLWAALNHPIAFLVMLVLFLALVVWLLPKLFRGIRAVGRKVAGWFGGGSNNPPSTQHGKTPLWRLWGS